MSKPGRNEPCPCGSGKKYKKCCFGKEEAEAAERERKQEQQEALMTMLVNLNRSLLDDKPHIKEYKKIRRLHGEIVNGMMEYYHEDKFQRQVITDIESEEDSEPKERIVTLLEATFDYDTREGAQALCEHIVYKAAPNVTCITEDFLNKHRYRKPEKIEFLQAMLDSYVGLFEITATDRQEGYAYLKDVFTDREFKITDTSICASPNFENYYMYTRVITYHGISFGTGLSLIFGKTDPFITKYIEREREGFQAREEFRRFIELYNRFSKYSNKHRVVSYQF
jgi:preprotein translocase subunit Sss1